jgi:uncharacterized protein (DUF1810 family)
VRSFRKTGTTFTLMFDLERFAPAQNRIYEQACAELRNGRKLGHKMWFIFPRLRGLEQSAIASKFGIASQQEAEAYLDHPILGARLRECTHLVNLVWCIVNGNSYRRKNVSTIEVLPDACCSPA